VKAKLLTFKKIYHLLNDTVRACLNGDLPSQGAALSYYTIFAIAPLFIITLAIAGFWFGEEAARRELFGQVDQLIGKQGGDAIQSLVAAANKSKGGVWATCIACGTLAVAATGVFVQLQNSLNKIWSVQSAGKGLRNFIRHRLLSFAMVFGIGFLLLVSLVCSAALAALGNFIGNYLSGIEILLKALNFFISLGIITALFTMIFKFLPDVKIAWRDVWLGGFITAVLFNIGKFLIGVYIGRSTISSVYGAMGSFVIVLVWVYYSAQILFFGAQFTCIYASRYGVKTKPIRRTRFVPTEIKHGSKTGPNRK
jgi:membrane protein